MKKKYIIGSVAALATLTICGYAIMQHQSEQTESKNKVAYVEKKANSKQNSKARKAENLKPDQVSAKEGIAAEQIVVKITAEGYVTSHGDHYHYYNGKVPFDAILSEELIMRDPNYQLQEADIVNQVKDGYIIKVAGKYYLYLTNAKETTNVRSVDEIARQRQLHPGKEDEAGAETDAKASQNQTRKTQDFSRPSASFAAGKRSTSPVTTASQNRGGAYTTDDGYVFSPSDIISDTGDGYLVPHAGHIHYIPKGDLSAANNSSQDQNTGHIANSNHQANHDPAPVPSQPSKPSQTGGVGLVTKPSGQGTEVSKNYQDELQKLYSMPKEKRYAEKDGLIFDPAKIAHRTAEGVAIPHGNHYHFIPYSSLSALEEEIARNIPIAGQKTYPKSATNTPIQPSKPSEPTKPVEKDDHGFHAENVISKDEEGYVVQHGGHAHYFFKKDLSADQIAAAEAQLTKQQHSAQASQENSDYDRFSRDASDEEKMAYISKTYGVPREAIKISKGFFVFNNPDQAYDPTHIHPYAVRKEHVRIPLQTGNPELDFLNELYTTALRDGVSPYSLQVESGSFVIPHGDHNHYIKVQTKGYEVALKNKIPALQSTYQPGAFDEQTVLSKVDQLLADSRSLYKDQPIMQRRVELALGQFTENMKKLATNSTAGYLAALDLFDKQYIHVDQSVAPVETSPLDKKYQALVDKINTLDTDTYGLPKKDLLVHLQEAKLAQDETELAAIEAKLQALQDFRDRTGVTTVEYIKYFYEHVSDGRLREELRNRVAKLTWELYQSQSFLKATDLNKLFPTIYQTKLEVEEALKEEPVSTKAGKTILDTEKVDSQTAKTAIYEFLKELYGDFMPEERVSHVKKEEVDALLTKAAQLLARVKEDGVKQSLAEEAANIKAATEKENADLDEAKTQLEDLLNRIAATIQREKKEAEQDPQTVIIYQKLYNVLLSLHKYLEDNKGSDADFERVDALFDQLAAKSSDKEGLLTLAKEIISLNQELRSKASETDSQSKSEKDSETATSKPTEKQAQSESETSAQPNE